MGKDDGKFIRQEDHDRVVPQKRTEGYDWEFELLYLARVFTFIFCGRLFSYKNSSRFKSIGTQACISLTDSTPDSVF